MRSVHSYTDNSDPLSIHPFAKKTSSTSTRPSRPKRHSPSAAATSTPEVSLSSSKPAATAPPLLRADAATPQSQARPPRDTNHHVLALTPTTRSAAQNTANMPPGDKPRQQQPGALAAKPIGRPPLTPKVALKAAPPPPLPPTSSQGHTSLANLHGRDASVAYVNGTTGRSGPRQSRGNSAGTTPSSTPNPERLGDTWDPHPLPHPHPHAGRPSPKPPLVRTESHGSIRQSPNALQVEPRSDSSDPRNDARSDTRSNTPKFMYSSEVKLPPSLSRPSSTQQKTAPTFFYASEAPPSKRSANPPANPTTSPPTKFFYANGTPELSSAPSRAPLVAIPSSGSGSSASTASRMVSVRPTTGNSTPGYGAPALTRPDSPAKGGSSSSTVSTNTNITTITSKPSRSSMTSPASPNRNQVYATPTIAAATNPAKRRVSIDAPPKVAKGHVRAGSVPSTDAFNATKFVMPTVVPAEPTSPPRSPGPPRVSMASLLQVAAEVDEGNGDTDDDDDDDDDDEADDDDEDGEDGGGGNSDSGEDGDDSEDDVSERGSHSPSKSSPNRAPVSDYVLSARRERKVQDLEIRNTSLEAINKTLERQLRKQSAELRRFRRLSRAGKLPMDATAQQRATEAPLELSDLSEEESVATTMDGEKEEEEEEEEEEDSYVSEDSSSTASAQSDDSNRRKRDERRLHHDLSRHKELLQDSQRMNQSLKRCLNWTEELIKEGQKALAHQVRVSDVQFGYGGRVLSPPDEDEDEEDVANDGSSQQADETLTKLGSDESVSPWVKGAQDRDSGIELPVDSG